MNVFFDKPISSFIFNEADVLSKRFISGFAATLCSLKILN